MNAMVKPMTAETARATGLEPDGYEVCVARTLNDLMQVVAVRTLVYMGEQACPYGEEYDGNDFAGATHLLLRFKGEPIGVLRMRWFADFAKFERVAVVKNHRGSSAILALIRAAIGLAERKGYRRILGHAEPRLVNFWARRLNARIRPRRGGFAFSDHEYVEIVTATRISSPPRSASANSFSRRCEKADSPGRTNTGSNGRGSNPPMGAGVTAGSHER